jgi:hypothetical protein
MLARFHGPIMALGLGNPWRDDLAGLTP